MKLDINPYLLGMTEISALVDFFNLSIADIKSYDELTPSEKAVITPEIFEKLSKSGEIDPSPKD